MTTAESLEALAALSRKYGADPDYVFLGGGNTSFKTDTELFIKPSGVALATIIAQTASWLFSLVYINRKYRDIAIHPFCFRFDR